MSTHQPEETLEPVEAPPSGVSLDRGAKTIRYPDGTIATRHSVEVWWGDWQDWDTYECHRRPDGRVEWFKVVRRWP